MSVGSALRWRFVPLGWGPASLPAEEIQVQLSLVVAFPKFSLPQVKRVCVGLTSALLEEEGLVTGRVGVSLSPHLRCDPMAGDGCVIGSPC